MMRRWREVQCPLAGPRHFAAFHVELGLLSCGLCAPEILSREEVLHRLAGDILHYRRDHPWLFEGVAPELDPEPPWLRPLTVEAWRGALSQLWRALPAELAARAAYRIAATETDLDHAAIVREIGEAARRAA